MTLTPPQLISLAALGALIACSADDSHPADTARSTAPPAAAVMPPPARAVATLPCLLADSLRSPNDTLHFSSLRVHEETGDQLGTDLQLVRLGTSWGGRVALAEGVLGQYSPLKEIRLDTMTGALTLHFDMFDRPAEFHGMLACATVIGEFRWGPGVEPQMDTLRRENRDGSGAP